MRTGNARLAHPAAVLGTAGIVAMFRELRVVGPIDLSPGPVQIAARIRDPAGLVELCMIPLLRHDIETLRVQRPVAPPCDA